MRNTLVTTRGKHRRSFWLGVGPVVVMLLALALALAPAASAEYGGSRWQHAGRAICVQTKDIRTTAVRDAVKRSVAKWNAETVLDVRARYNCSGYSQIIVVTDRHYDRKSSGWVEWKGGFKWFYPATTGPWTTSLGGTFAHQSPVAVRVNRRYTDGYTSHKRQHVVSHEIGHALGLGHNGTCKSVMVPHWNCGYMYKYGGWWDWAGKSTNPGINQLYARG